MAVTKNSVDVDVENVSKESKRVVTVPRAVQALLDGQLMAKMLYVKVVEMPFPIVGEFAFMGASGTGDHVAPPSVVSRMLASEFATKQSLVEGHETVTASWLLIAWLDQKSVIGCAAAAPLGIDTKVAHEARSKRTPCAALAFLDTHVRPGFVAGGVVAPRAAINAAGSTEVTANVARERFMSLRNAIRRPERPPD